MLNMNTIQPSISHLFHAFGMNLVEGFANWRHRIETHLEERRLRAELESMSERERLEIDVTAGNNAWTVRR
jgi:uncharacterized protein YjiS (DUF1127 family)